MLSEISDIDAIRPMINNIQRQQIHISGTRLTLIGSGVVL